MVLNLPTDGLVFFFAGVALFAFFTIGVMIDKGLRRIRKTRRENELREERLHFSLHNLVAFGLLEHDETVYFVSNKRKKAKVYSLHDRTYLYLDTPRYEGLETLGRVVTEWLGQEPPDHPSKWVKNSKNVTLHDLWESRDKT